MNETMNNPRFLVKLTDDCVETSSNAIFISAIDRIRDEIGKLQQTRTFSRREERNIRHVANLTPLMSLGPNAFRKHFQIFAIAGFGDDKEAALLLVAVSEYSLEHAIEAIHELLEPVFIAIDSARR